MRTEPKEAEDGKIWVSGWGNTEAKVMIITSHPSIEDLRAGYILSHDDDGYGPIDEIKSALNASGLKEDDCWFTSIVKCGIGSKDKPNSKQIEEGAAELDEEIESIKPRLIMTLGAEAFKRVMKQNISQSSYVGEIIDCPYGKVLANYSPANVYRVDPKLRPEFMENFDLAKRFVNGNLKYKDFEYLLVKDPEVNKMILQHYMDNDMWSIGYDAEWKGKFMKDEQMYAFQYSCEPDKAIILQIMQDDGTMNLELLKTMEVFLSHPKADRLGWNIRADDKRLRLLGLNIPDENIGFDGMKAVAFFDSRWRKGLETGIKRFTNYRPYYNELYKKLREHKRDAGAMCDMMKLEPATWWTYCAGDAVSHREACINMRKEMKLKLPKPVSKYYFDVYLPLSHYLTDMELTGLPIDKYCIDTITKQYNECYDLLYTRLMSATKQYGFDTQAYDASVAEIGEEATLELGLRPDFNPRSAAQKKYFFFERLKLKPAYYVKKGKAKPRAWYEKQTPQMQKHYQPSANGKSMATIRFELVEMLKNEPDDEELQSRFQIVKDYLDLARVSVFSHKFLSKVGVEDDVSAQNLEEGEGLTVGDDDGDEPLKASYWGAICNDGKIHADFFECLDNFRSSSRVNVQNPASKVLSHIPGIFSQFELEAPKNIRNIFYTGDPDYHFAEVDVAGADLAIAAFLSKDPDYIRDILKGGFHTTKMREYFKDPKLSKEEASKYVTSKSITFRVAYTAGLMSAALPIQAEIYAENGDFVDIEVIKYALRTWERYRTYMDYREDCQNQVKNDQMIINARGIKYHFEYTDDFAIQAGWLNQALAYPIASELALFMWDISVKIKEYLKKEGVWMKYCYPCNVVHDANYWLVHKDLMKDNFFPEVCKQIFTKDVKIATGDNLGMEMVVADRWKGKEKVFAKETKWNFENKTWEWEK
jgi:DNA polymerase